MQSNVGNRSLSPSLSNLRLQTQVTQQKTMDEGCDMMECCLCGAVCGACCASASGGDDDRRRNGRYSGDYRHQQPTYVQPVMVQHQPGYPGHGGYGAPQQGYGPPPGEYNQYPPQQYPPQQYPPQQYPPQQQYPSKY